MARGERLLSIPLKGVHLHLRRPPATAAVRPGRFRVCRGGQEKVSSNPRTGGGSASPREGPGGHLWVDAVTVVTQERAWEDTRWMDVVSVVTPDGAWRTPLDGCGHGGDPGKGWNCGWTWSWWSPRGGPGRTPLDGRGHGGHPGEGL